MNDRELLELAARAAGYKVHWHRMEGGWADGHECWRHEDGIRFDPLTDDGDALRLAVRLRLLIGSTDSDEAWVQFYRNGNKPMGYATVEQPHDGDPCAATRRAIVLAAAELGKGMVK